MPTPIVSANLITTTLLNPVSNAATVIVVPSSAIIPGIAAEQYCSFTISDAATNTVHEIVRATSVVVSGGGISITVVRGQEGTVARAWNAGDLVQNLWTAGDFMAAADPRYATDTGAVNVMVVAYAPSPFRYYTGMIIRVLPANTNTSNVTININGLGAKNVVQQNGAALTAGMLVIGTLFEMIYDGTSFRVMNAVSTANFPSSLGVNGWKKYPDQNSPSGYFIEQWVTGAADNPNGGESAAQALTLPITFPNAIMSSMVCTRMNTNTISGDTFYQTVGTDTISTVTVRLQATGVVTTGTTYTPTLWVKGY